MQKAGNLRKKEDEEGRSEMTLMGKEGATGRSI